MDLSALVNDVINIAKKTGAFIAKEKKNFDYDRVEIKGLNDLVSYVDKEAEKMIVAGLRSVYPGAGFIVEENTAVGKKEYNWIVDPLDGTTNFIHGIPCYAVSIALERNGDILAGVVYEISRDECFSASTNNGAFLNGRRIRVSPRKRLSESLIATGFPVYNFERETPFFSCLRHFMQHTHGLRRIGSAATDLCYLACGRFDAFFEYNLKPWDVAAGALIVKEAGGVVTDFSGGTNWLFGQEMAASNAALDVEFRKVVGDHFQSA